MLLASLICAVLTFGPALHGTFIFDDFHLPFADPNASRMPASFWLGGVRPLLMATYWFNYLTSGVDTFSYHALNLLLHAMCTGLVWLILKRIYELAGYTDRRAMSIASLFGAAVFLVHPLQTESVDYIAGRSETLCGLFVLTGWYIFLRSFTRRTSAGTAIAILACAVGAILSKESGICIIPLLLATDVYWRTGNITAQLKQRLPVYVPVIAGGAVASVLVLRQLGKSVTAGFASGSTPFEYALAECRAIMIYLRLFLYPVGQNIDWRLPFPHSIRDGDAAIFVVLMLVLLAAIVYLYGKLRLLSFSLLVFLIALSPTSSFLPVQDALAERRMYLPLAGLALLPGALFLLVLLKTPRMASAAQIALTAIVLTLAVVSHARSELWASDIEIWRDSLARNPSNIRAHDWLAGAYMLRRDCAPAALEYKAETDLAGFNAENARNLAVAYDCAGQRDAALTTWRALAKLHPSAEAYNRIGFLEAMRNDVDGSLSAFEEALHLDPANAESWALRGTARMALRDTARAKEDFHRALALDPGNATAAAGIAKLPTYR